MIRNILLALTFIMTGSFVMAQEVACPEGYVCTKNDNTSTVVSETNSTTTVKSPPATAVSPSINASNSDLCTVGVSGAVQTQILGISAGKTVRDMNCEKLKNAKTLYDMGMKVAAVATMCQDERVFEAMMNAGTPCPYDGLIGDEAKLAWKADQEQKSTEVEQQGLFKGMDKDDKSTIMGTAGAGGLLLLLLLL